jgi:hypothetical protein
VSGRPAIARMASGIATGGHAGGVNLERGERRHQVRLPLISTRGRVQIGSGLDCTCSITQWGELLVDDLLGVARKAMVFVVSTKSAGALYCRNSPGRGDAVR